MHFKPRSHEMALFFFSQYDKPEHEELHSCQKLIIRLICYFCLKKKKKYCQNYYHLNVV